MLEDAKNIEAKVVGTNLEGYEGSVTFSIPVEQLSSLRSGYDETIGGWLSNNHLGERYGLRRDSQVITLPITRDSKIDLARDLYKNEPLVANVIDLMVDFCMTGMENRCSDKKAKRYFDGICKYSDFDSLHRDIFREYLISGDVFILRGKKRTVSYGKDKGTVYFDYTVLNPKFVEVSGPLIFNQELIGIKPNKELVSVVKKGDVKLLRDIPAPLKEAAKHNKLYYPPVDKISRISRARAPYERYAEPYLSRVFEPVLIKRRMREADLALVETVRNVLVTITIGDKDFPATQKQLEALANLFENPSKSMELFWNHTLKVEYHYPDPELFNNDKYEQVNKDILQGLGIPPVLIDGGGGTFATAWTSLLSVVERLQSVRDQVARWQESEYRRIVKTEKLNFKDIPSVFFKPLNLRDDKVFKNMLLEMYDRGLISIETILEYTDLDLEVEYKNKVAEKKTGIDSVFEAKEDAPSKIGRPSTKVDPGNYSPRDEIPEVDVTDNETDDFD